MQPIGDKYIKQLQIDNNVLQVDVTTLDHVRKLITNEPYIEFIFHKLFDSPECKFSDYDISTCQWSFPECWVLRYYLYFVLHKELIQGANILDLGSNLNFYAVWAMLNGANKIDSVEAEKVRYKLSLEYVGINNLTSYINTVNQTIDEFIKEYHDQKYDVVFLLDVLYYFSNGIDVLQFIKDTIKPKYLFLESTVVDDYCNSGHFNLWTTSGDPKIFQSYTEKSALVPSRNALNNVIKQLGWKIVAYYDYQNFIGRGESPPRKSGHKSFYILRNEQTDN